MRAPWPLLFVTMMALPAGCLRLMTDGDDFPCSANSDCRSGETCRYVSHAGGRRCVPRDWCESNVDCGTLQICERNACVDVECTLVGAGQCAPYECDQQTHTCLTSCEWSSDCAPGNACAGDTCQVPDCERGEYEVPACGGYLCVAQVCQTTCSGYEGCASTHACVEDECVSALDHADGDACDDNSWCASRRCQDGVCIPIEGLALGSPCSSSSACASGRCAGECIDSEGLPARSPCESDEWCHSGICTDGLCVPDHEYIIGTPCEEDSWCESGVCCMGTWPYGRSCVAQSEDLAVGESCVYGCQCADGVCIRGSASHTGSGVCSRGCINVTDCSAVGSTPWRCVAYWYEDGVLTSWTTVPDLGLLESGTYCVPECNGSDCSDFGTDLQCGTLVASVDVEFDVCVP